MAHEGVKANSLASENNDEAADTVLAEKDASHPVVEDENKIETSKEATVEVENGTAADKEDDPITEENNEDNPAKKDGSSEKNSLKNNEGNGEDTLTKGGEKDGKKEDKEKDTVVEYKDEANADEPNEQKSEEISRKKAKKMRQQSRKKKVAKQETGNVAPNGNDKPESSSRKDVALKGKGKLSQLSKKASKRAESMGMIFMCNSATKKDCYHYKVLGLPASKKDLVEKVYKGMRLFLYDVDLKLMYGVYKAAGPGGYNIEPKAFKSQYPSQVRFTVLCDCLPLAEENFKQVIKKNYFTKTKFDCQLSSEQVKDLCKLFTDSGKGSSSKKKVKSHRAENREIADRERRTKRRRIIEERRPSLQEDRYPPRTYEREVVTPPVVHVPRVYVPSPSSLYPYDRPTSYAYRSDPLLKQRNSYRHGHGELVPRDAYSREYLVEARDHSREYLVETRDPYRQDFMLKHRDPYRQDALLDPHDVYKHDGLDRREAMVDRRDLQPLTVESHYRDEIRSREPYLSRREPLSYRVPAYSEYNPPSLPAEYHLGRSTETRPTAAQPSDLYSSRPLYRY